MTGSICGVMPTATLVANSSASMTLPLVAALMAKTAGAINEHEAYEQHGDARDAVVKRALLAAPVEHLGDAAQVGVRAGGNDKRHGGAVLHGGAGKDDVLAGRERQRGAVGTIDDGDGSGLLDGLALAGECGLDHKQVARVMTRASAGTISPAERRITSPGTSSSKRISTRSPSRRTVQVLETRSLRASAALPLRLPG